MMLITIGIVHTFLGWCTVINFVIILISCLMLKLARNWIYEFHKRWFKKLSIDKFDEIHYTWLIFFKMFWLFLNFAPYIALCIVIR